MCNCGRGHHEEHLCKIIFDLDLLFRCHFKIFMSPKPKGGGILVLVRIPSAPAIFISVSYLLDQWMDFDQTCIDTLLVVWFPPLDLPIYVELRQ